jgi:hypothetical protein
MPGVNVTVQAMPAVATARASIAGVVISADGTVRETFGGPTDTATARFEIVRFVFPNTGTAIRWALGLVLSGVARELFRHYVDW